MRISDPDAVFVGDERDMVVKISAVIRIGALLESVQHLRVGKVKTVREVGMATDAQMRQFRKGVQPVYLS